jgi:hypothetical protein
MNPSQHYEIFQKLPSEQPTWVESATTLDDAVNRLNQLAEMFPANYFIVDCMRSHFIIPVQRASLKTWAVPMPAGT